MSLAAALTFRQLLGAVLLVIGLFVVITGLSMHRRRVDKNASVPPSLENLPGEKPGPQGPP